LNREVASTAIEHHFQHWQQVYQDNENILLYLTEMRENVLDHLEDFTQDEQSEEQEPKQPDLHRYGVNLLVDNSQTNGAPVIVEPNPTYVNLIGRIEYETQYGVMVTHFMNLKAGSLHQANGGYLIINARDILRGIRKMPG
jgi:predicted ATP-dependent protease